MYRTERFNSISHLVGALAAIVGAVVLVASASRQGDPWKIFSFSVYGASLVSLYVLSTLYHSFRGRLKPVFRTLDHLAIYVLIAGTYTPLTLVALRGNLGWLLFGVVWGLASIGIVVDLFPRRGRRFLPVIIYLLMGWLCLVAVGPLIRAISLGGFLWLLAGGLSYTLGIVFYALGARMRHAHGIWHLFVMAGSLAHYIAILLYIA
jgi:hemolysin III